MAKAPTQIRSLARSHTEKAVNVLAGIMNQADAPPVARVSAAGQLLDRGWGKPTQGVQHSGSVGVYDLSNVSDSDLERLESILGPIAHASGDPDGEGEEGGSGGAAAPTT